MDKHTSDVRYGVAPAPPEAQLSTGDLLREIAGKVTLLAKTEVELAKNELRADLRSEVKMATGLGIAGVGALLTLNLLFVALVFALAEELPGWGAALIVAGFTLLVTAIVGLLGWSKRVKHPMDQTIKTLKEDVQWTKERLA